jgi:hypothetical protein
MVDILADELTNEEKILLFDTILKKKKSDLMTKNDNPIEVLRETINPTEYEQSEPHNLVDHDGAFSNFPDARYALLIAEFKIVASYFQESKLTKVAALIHAEANQKAWQLMGTNGWLREKLNETKTTATLTKNENTGQRGTNFKLENLR